MISLLRRCLPAWRLFRVQGGSMLPTLKPGEVLWVRARRDALPPEGAIVVVRDPEEEGHLLVKRAHAVGGGEFRVSSDMPHGARDSRRFGPLKPQHLIGIATRAWGAGSGLLGRRV